MGLALAGAVLLVTLGTLSGAMQMRASAGRASAEPGPGAGYPTRAADSAGPPSTVASPTAPEPALPPPSPPTPSRTAMASTPGSTLHRADQLLARMTLEEKVGQLFMVFFEENTFSPSLAQMIRDCHVGGILLFSRNISTMADLAALLNQAQDTARGSGASIPLFVAVDQEGGPVVRLRSGATVFPSNMAVGATGSAELAQVMAATMSAEMKALGINMTLAPVLDVNNNPANTVIGIRSFGSSPELVARLGRAMIDAYHASGILTTAKHFPGHGDTRVDSHTSLPVIPHNLDRLQQVELVPFKVAVAEGVDAVMVAHVVFPAIDPTPDLPATFSPIVLQRVLREQMGFQGLIATDSLGMGALDRSYGPAEAAVTSFEAGADLLMFGNDPGHHPADQRAAFDRLVQMVKDGTIPLGQVDASVRRILLAKAKYGLLDARSEAVTTGQEQVGSADHLAAAHTVAAASITLVRDDARLLPLRPEAAVLVVYPRSMRGFAASLARRAAHVREVELHLDPTPAETTQVLQMARTAEAVVVGTVDAEAHPGQAQLVRQLSDRPLAIVALDSPYDLLAYPTASTYLASYGWVPASLDAVADVLYGAATPHGHLPVELPGLYPLGHGLDQFPRLAAR